MRWLDIITDSIHMNLSTLLGIVRDREAWPLQSVGSQRDLVTEQHMYIWLLSLFLVQSS